MAGVILSAAIGWLPIAISALAGVLLMIATSCLRWRDAARALNTQVILIVVASLALGSALLKTGAADYVAQLFIAATLGASPTWLLSGLMLMMACSEHRSPAGASVSLAFRRSRLYLLYCLGRT